MFCPVDSLWFGQWWDLKPDASSYWMNDWVCFGSFLWALISSLVRVGPIPVPRRGSARKQLPFV